VDWATIDPKEIARIGLEMDEYDQHEMILAEKLAAQNEAKMRKLEENTIKADRLTVKAIQEKIEDWNNPYRRADHKERTVMMDRPKSVYEDDVFIGPRPTARENNKRIPQQKRKQEQPAFQRAFQAVGGFFKKLFT
jgi:hypothetical protein